MAKLYRILPFLLVLSSCHRDDPVNPPPPSPLSVPQEVKDYCYFKPGSYWVYRDTATGIEDSVFTLSAQTGWDTAIINGKEQAFEWFQCITRSDLDGYDYYYWTNMTWKTSDGRVPVFREKTTIGDYEGKTILLSDKFSIPNIMYPYSQNGIVSFVAVLDSFQINNEAFFNVVKFNDTENITENYNNTNFYISKHIGIIKKELLDSNTVWELVRYSITQ
ncbi:MAG: hypothetical protein AB1458_07115 [Bacteroidota bacterium]